MIPTQISLKENLLINDRKSDSDVYHRTIVRQQKTESKVSKVFQIPLLSLFLKSAWSLNMQGRPLGSLFQRLENVKAAGGGRKYE
jgi:hypothetical protein